MNLDNVVRHAAHQLSLAKTAASFEGATKIPSYGWTGGRTLSETEQVEVVIRAALEWWNAPECAVCGHRITDTPRIDNNQFMHGWCRRPPGE